MQKSGSRLTYRSRPPNQQLSPNQHQAAVPRPLAAPLASAAVRGHARRLDTRSTAG